MKKTIDRMRSLIKMYKERSAIDGDSLTREFFKGKARGMEEAKHMLEILNENKENNDYRDLV